MIRINCIRTGLVLGGLACVLAGSGCGEDRDADFERGMEAYSQQDYEMALRIWRPLAERGHSSSQSNLGVMYYQGLGVRRNFPEALKWYRMAAVQGHPDAQYNLGFAYTEGRAARRDFQEAVQWYTMSAEQGYAPAQLVLGDMYSRGQGMEKDSAEAAKWYLMAAGQGYFTAIFKAGSIYLSGEGVEPDPVRAYMWFAVAAALAPEGAREPANRNKELVALQMTPEQIAEAEELARNWRPLRSPDGRQ